MRTVVIGDVHGCLDELDELVRKLEVKSSDRVIMLGDLVDRGPDPVGCVRRVREAGWECVLGNHEQKAIQWLKNESLRRASGRPNNMMTPSPARMAQWNALSADDVGWMWRLPMIVKTGRWTVVHAGFEPRFSVDKQDGDKILRVRYVDERTGKYVPLSSDVLAQPPGTVFWAEMWDGPESVLYGHSVWKSPRVHDRPGGVSCVGLDTGCVYGGDLTAGIVDAEEGVLELVSVRAKKEYFSYGDRASG